MPDLKSREIKTQIRALGLRERVVRSKQLAAMEVELKEMLSDLEALKRSLPDSSLHSSIDKVYSLFISSVSTACFVYTSKNWV